MTRPTRSITAAALLACWLAPSAAAQTLSGTALVDALRGGGHVIVMRHASAPYQPSGPEDAVPGNVALERQLDGQGRASAAAMGDAIRRLRIPLGEVLTSAAYRTRETARLMGLTAARPVVELGEAAQAVQRASPAQIAWLRQKVRSLPRGTNILLVTHAPNIAGAFPEFDTIAEGEALVFGADGQGGARPIGRVRIDEWPSF